MANIPVKDEARLACRIQAYELAEMVAKQHPRGYDDHLILYYQIEILKALENASGMILLHR